MDSYKKIDQIKQKSLDDLYFFAKEILNYDKMAIQPHREVCDFITKSKKKKRLILLPRGCFKSTLITIAYTLWKLMKDPDQRILISSETYAQSKTFLAAIKLHITDNEVFRGIFGDQKKDDSVWRQEEITIAGRKKVAREPSILVSGVGQVKTGLHFDTIILDDVVSEKNINTPEQIMKTLDHYKLLHSILEPGGELDLVGTRYSFADLYGHILEEEASAFDILIRSAIDDDGKFYFPTRLTKSFLDAQRKAQGSLHFANQYLNKCIDDGSAMFRVDWVRFYRESPQGLNVFMLIDPASTATRTSDFTGIVICGVDHNSNIFIIEAINNKSTIGEMVNLIFNKVVQYDINLSGTVALETNANQQTYKYIFSEEMNKRNFYFPITELKPSSIKSKAMRIKGLQPYFENGKIYLKKDQTDLYHQIVMYPRTKHDDLIDALSNILQVMAPPTVKEPSKWEGSILPINEMNIWKEKDKIGLRKVRQTKRW